ncbi:error-prone DNA polymerase [Falsiroseomonas bella]|uniref:Error-prone DNA polymerase n=1 Tax=Falsiroseomonas bella TaxID=2184016 RepID=A0A317FEW8_9PROT|nr:error-prone DNA polymerase [Falsiroseomonas bella]PWS37654.1 error-prone DNA polymerase [Falsiroseomonas bella]
MTDEPFAELGALSNFTFLEGASHPRELAVAAKALGMSAFGIADRNSVAGLVRGMVAAEQVGIHFVAGIRLCLVDGTEYLAWPADRAAWGRLCRMLSAARMQGEKGDTRLTREMLLDHAEGSVMARIPPAQVAPDFARSLRADARALNGRTALPLFCTADHRCRGDDQARLDALAALGVPLIAAGGVRYHVASRRRVADVLTAIRLGRTVETLGYAAEANAEAHLLPPAEVARRLARFPEAIAATARVRRACRFSLRDLSYEYPEEILDPGRTAQETLAARVAEACRAKWPDGVPEKVRRQIRHELSLIAQMDYAPYFLTVHEIVRFAHDQKILCQGRGSAANSAVCYVLGITAVAPDKHDMLFERFISAARDEPPDIDVDFEHERREEVIQHIYRSYGRDRAAITATLIRYRERSAIREVGKAMGLTEDVTARIAKSVWGAGEKSLEDLAADNGLRPDADPRIRHAMEIAEEIQDFPRHLATHVGGFVITKGPLTEHTVVVKAAMEDRTTIEWDKDDIEALRILKVDVLGLGMLTCIRRAFALIEGAGGKRYTLQDVPQDDPETYKMLRRGDSIGVFQVESRAQMNMLPRLRPKEFYDLVIEVAIVRPGPIQGDMVHPYLRRRNGEEPVEIPHGLEGVLKKTLGVPLFQEQAMKIAIVGAGFSPSRADELRRAMATFRNTGEIWKFREEFLAGMAANGYDADFAQRCFRQLEGFGTYGFPESHAASFASLVYVSAWIKRHHPAAFAAALLNSQPMGFYAPAQIVRDAKEHDVEVRAADVMVSDWDCALEVVGDGTPTPTSLRPRGNAASPRYRERGSSERRSPSPACGGGLGWGSAPLPALRLGLRLIAGLRKEDADSITAARAAAPFRDVADLARRARLDRGAMDALARADALRSLTQGRRHALWEAAGVEAALPLSEARDAEQPTLPDETAGEQTVLDYAATGLSLRRHPLALLRPVLRERGAVDTRALNAARQGRWLRLAGLVLVRQRPGSAKGVVFFTVEDEFGTGNLVLYPDIVSCDRAAVIGARLVLAEGRVERMEQAEVPIIHLVVRRLHDWSGLLDGLHRLEDPATTWGRVLANADEVRSPNLHDPRDPAVRAGKSGAAAMPPSRDFR